jgi:Ca2+-binding RTX toxin-like protein
MVDIPKTNLDFTQAGAQITRTNEKWGNNTIGTAATITYGYDPDASIEFIKPQKDNIVAALAYWSDIANITFEFEPEAEIGNPDLYYSNEFNTDLINGRAYGPDVPVFGGEIFMNYRNNNSKDSTYVLADMSFAIGTDRYRTLIHETGHALGLEHPSNYNKAASFGPDAVYNQDTAQYSIMSYFGKTEKNADGVNLGVGPIERWQIATPLLHDIAAIQRLYGVNTTTRTGSDIYGFNSTTGRAGLTLSKDTDQRAFAIWDAGGAHDKLDFSGYATRNFITLVAAPKSGVIPTEGVFSNVGGLIGNVVIAPGVVIEDATGGSGQDTIFGNSANNIINGGAGVDLMSGGVGSDTYYVDNAADIVDDHRVLPLVLPPGADSGVDTIFSTVNYGLQGTFAEKLVLLESAKAVFASGSSGRDTLVGNSLANILTGYQGDDSLSGGGGNDLYVGVTVGDNVNELINGGTDTVETAALTYTLQANVEILKSTLDLDPGQGGVQFFGNAIGNTINATAGADQLEGGSGDDKLFGFGSNDFFVGGAGADFLDGGFLGADTDTASYEDSVAGVIVALQAWRFDSGSILISSLPVAAGSRGGDAAGDTLKSIENILGSNARDTLVGDVFDNVLHGNGGRDFLAGAGGDDLLFGSDISKMTSTDAKDQLEGGTGDDTFYVVGSEDRLVERANEGTDTIRAQLWSSTGQLGGFVAYSMVEGATAQVENLTYTGSFYSTFDGPDLVTEAYYGAFYGTGNSLNNVITGGSKDDVLVGLVGNDTLIGKLGADGLYGGLGNDLLIGGEGADRMDGDDGIDTITYADSNAPVTVALAAGFFPAKILGIDTFIAVKAGLRGGDAQGDVALNVENILGSTGGDTLIGNSVGNYISGDLGNDRINGGLGSDLLVGGLGTDLILGGDGNDEIRGGVGADTMDGGLGVDTLSFAGSTSAVTAAFERATYGSGLVLRVIAQGLRGGDAQGDVATDFENIIGSSWNDTLVGSAVDNNLSGREGNDFLAGRLGNDSIRGDGGNDTINGDGGTDTLDGGNGNDIINGGIGADVMNGGSGSTTNGNDTFYVDDLGDRVTDTGSGDNDIVYSSVNFALTTGIDSLVLTGSNAINGTGTAESNSIAGNTAANRLDGGAGNDTLIGGAGIDTLTGGAGVDTFVFNSSLNGLTNVDTIADFKAVDDTILLQRSVFASLPAPLVPETLAAKYFKANATGKASDLDDRIIYNTTTGVLSYDSNGSLAGGDVQFAVLTGRPTITHLDFMYE